MLKGIHLFLFIVFISELLFYCSFCPNVSALLILYGLHFYLGNMASNGKGI